MNYILIKIIIALYSFIVTNPSIPQDVKDQALQIVGENSSAIQQDSCSAQTVSNQSMQTPVTQGVSQTEINNNQTTMSAPVQNTDAHIVVKGDGITNDSVTIQQGQTYSFSVFIYATKDENGSLRNKVLHIETTDPLGFDRIGGYSGDQKPTTTSQDVNGTSDVAGRNGFYYPVRYSNQTLGTQTFTFSVPDMNLSKTITVNVQ